MQAMSGITAVASRWTISAGTLFAIGGGLVLYQMTSLVLGPAGSRQLHVSLTIPATEVDESSLAFASSVNLALGMLTGPASVSVSHHAPSTPAPHRAVAPAVTRVVTTPPVVPVTPVGSPQPPVTHPSEPPLPVAGLSDQQTDPQNLHDND
jgi:hypothetical protein